MMNAEERKKSKKRRERLDYQKHREERLAKSKKYHHEHKEELKIKRKEYYQKNKDRLSEQTKKISQKIKMEILCHYGGDLPKCSCCGDSHIEFLSIDHIDGNGTQHRKKIGVGGGTNFYYWLRKNNYPVGYRVLCHNCNASLGYYGYCPHNKEA